LLVIVSKLNKKVIYFKVILITKKKRKTDTLEIKDGIYGGTR